MPKRYFTPAGVRRLEDRRKALADKLREIQGQKGEAAEVGGNQWHDNFSFEDLSRQEMMVNKQLAELSEIENDMVVVWAVPQQTERLSIGHVAVLDFGGEMRVFRVGGYDESDPKTNPQTVAYNAPLLAPFFGEEEGHEEVVQIGNVRTHATLEEIRLEVKHESGA